MGATGRWSQWNFEACSGAEVTNQSGDPPPNSFLATPPGSRLHLPFCFILPYPHPRQIVLWQGLGETSGK